jgi:cobalt/nickel transport system permease protein
MLHGFYLFKRVRSQKILLKGVLIRMHIPDGYLSPVTALPIAAVMVPIIGIAVKKVQTTMKKKQAPLLAIGAAFSFLIMMFNLPIPGGSSAHAVGAVLIAILLGPWAATVAVTVALIIQAMIFGDGGIITLGANCFNIAFLMSFGGYYSYRLIKAKADASSIRGLVAAACGGYIGINLAALSTAVMFGMQYHWFQGPDGTPLYFMYPLKVALTVMMGEHLLFAGPVESAFTVLGVLFVARTYPEMIGSSAIKTGKTKGVMANV